MGISSPSSSLENITNLLRRNIFFNLKNTKLHHLEVFYKNCLIRGMHPQSSHTNFYKTIKIVANEHPKAYNFPLPVTNDSYFSFKITIFPSINSLTTLPHSIFSHRTKKQIKEMNP